MSDAPVVEVTRDHVNYRASALGGCTKQLVAARLGYEPVPLREDSQMARVFRAGHEAEELAFDHMTVDGYGISYKQHEVVLPITERIRIIGHIDGIGNHEDLGEALLIEVKSQNQQAWDEFDAHGWFSGLFLKYRWQVSVYMHAMRSPLLLVRWLREAGEPKISYHKIEEPFFTLEEIRARVLKVEALARQVQLPDTCDPVTYPCPYFYLHEDTDIDTADDEFDGLCQVYKQAQTKVKVAKDEWAKAKNTLHAYVGGVGKKETANYRMSVYMQKGPPKLDRELLVADGIDLAKYSTQTESERVRVTSKNGENT